MTNQQYKKAHLATVLRDLGKAKKIKVKEGESFQFQCQSCGIEKKYMWKFYEEIACSKDCMKALISESLIEFENQMKQTPNHFA